jgi:hypothetical protein
MNGLHHFTAELFSLAALIWRQFLLAPLLWKLAGFPSPFADRSLVKRDRNGYYLRVTFDRKKMKQALAELAANGVFGRHIFMKI